MIDKNFLNEKIVEYTEFIISELKRTCGGAEKAELYYSRALLKIECITDFAEYLYGESLTEREGDDEN